MLVVPLVKPEVGTGQPCVVIVAKTGRVLYIKRENKTTKLSKAWQWKNMLKLLQLVLQPRHYAKT